MRLPWKVFTIVLAVLLGVSIVLLVVLAALVMQLYREVQVVSLNPLSLEVYAAESPDPNLRTVVFFGDSRAYDWPAPEGLAGLAFVNRGIYGQTSAQVALRFDAHVRPLSPDVIVLQMCVNDLKTIPLLPDQRDSIIAGCKFNIEQVIAQAQAIGAQVILTTIFPVGNVPLIRQPIWSDDVAASVREVNDGMRALERDGVTVFDTYALLVDADGLLRHDLSIDALHLNDVGYALLNEQLAALLLTGSE